VFVNEEALTLGEMTCLAAAHLPPAIVVFLGITIGGERTVFLFLGPVAFAASF